MSQLAPASRPFQWEYLFKAMLGLGEPDQAILAAAEAPMLACAGVLEGTLRKQPFLAGEQLTLADISIVASLVYAEAARMPLAEFPALQRWRQTVAATPAWSVARPPAKVAA